MRHDNIDCQKRYYKQGDIAPVYPMPWRCEPFIGTVESVRKNPFGRVSYVINGMQVFTEELFPAKHQTKLRIKCGEVK